MWRKSSKSNSDGTCVEVRDDLAALRDSKQPAFVKNIKDGRFDR